jgi:hypothetical protein
MSQHGGPNCVSLEATISACSESPRALVAGSAASASLVTGTLNTFCSASAEFFSDDCVALEAPLLVAILSCVARLCDGVVEGKNTPGRCQASSHPHYVCLNSRHTLAMFMLLILAT